MPTAPQHPTTSIPGMCLLHADYHPLTADCWTHMADWFFDHQHLADTDARDWYQADVERAMLDNLLPILRRPR